jgi:acyl-CoA reductase-like NAD-dependent aldehyde dehydrogenase
MVSGETGGERADPDAYLIAPTLFDGADVHVPFGGSKTSGYDPHEQGRAAIEFYTEEITVYRDV